MADRAALFPPAPDPPPPPRRMGAAVGLEGLPSMLFLFANFVLAVKYVQFYTFSNIEILRF